MKKNLRYILLGMLMLVAGTVGAENVITFTAGTDVGTQTNAGAGADAVSKGGVTISVTKGALAAAQYRFAKGETATFTSTVGNITKVVFTCSASGDAQYGPGCFTNATAGTYTYDDKTGTWTGEAAEFSLTAASAQVRATVIEVTIDGEPSTEPVEPQKKMVRVYKKVNAIESGKAYVLVGEKGGALKIAKNVTGNYGYLQVDDVTDKNGEVTFANNTAEFTFTATDGGYTILQADGRYVYQTGTYNSFNVSAEPTEGQVWTAEAQQDGTFLITNVSVGKYIQLDSNYGTYGSYNEEKGTLPSLYVYDREEEASNEPVQHTAVADLAAFAAVSTNDVVELTLKDAQVLYVNNYNGTKELFVRDASGAADLYNLGIDAEAGQVLNGTIVGKRSARSGFTVAMIAADDTDAKTVTVGAAQAVEPVEVAIDEATTAYVCDLIQINSVAVADKKATDDGVELALYDRFKLGIVDQLKDDGSLYNLTGLMYDGGTTYGPELVVIAATYADGTPLVEEEPVAVESIEALLALDSPTSNVQLTLTDAQVLFNDNNYIYVRENGRALCFYQMPDAVKALMATGAVLNGSVRVDYEVYRLLPEVKANAKTTADALTATEGEAAVPVETTLAEVAQGKHVCDLVTLKATKLVETSESGVNTYYLQSGDVKLVVVNNGKGLNKIDDGVEITVTGIVNTSNDAYQVKLTQTVQDPAGIRDMELAGQQQSGKCYDLQGRKIEQSSNGQMQPGLYIMGGRKVIVK